MARIGGDEFVALLAPLRSADEAIRVANRIVQGIRAIDLVEGLPVKVGVSAGVALFPDDAAELESLMIRADAAMYIAKRHRNGGLCLSGESASVVVGGDADHLPAVPVHELALLFQPWMDLHRGVYHGVEAMVRRQESALYEVIGSLDSESGGAMEHLGDWIIEHAAAQWLVWAELKIAPTCVAISLTHSELAQPQLAERWLQILLRLGMSPSRLQVQVAEHVCKEPAGSVIFENLRALRECGVRVVVAHFGREDASLTLLGRSPIDGVKLDKSLLHDLRSGKPEAHALVAAVLSVAHARGLDVIAAGIENEDDLRRCEDLNFPFAQGFWLSEPLPAKRLTTLLQDSVSARAVLEMTAQPAFAGSHAA